MRRTGNICVCWVMISLQCLRHGEIAHMTEILPWMDMMGICFVVRAGQRSEVVELLFV